LFPLQYKGASKMTALNLLLKPASGSCNLRCRYCFYADEAGKRETACHGLMTEDTAESIISKSFATATATCHFGFQGGEPMLRGLAFYEKFIALCEGHNASHIQTTYSIQTNGTLIDDQWARFFRRHHFLVGVSLDGDKTLHDLNRVDAEGKGSFDRVLQALWLLEKYDVEYNILTVVTSQTVRNIERIYHFYKKNNLRYQQYIPCLDPLGESRGDRDYSLTPDGYGNFLCRLFDLWYHDYIKGELISNRYFENLAAILYGLPPESCGMSGICNPQITVEADGSVYPCDFYMLDAYRLGNFRQGTFADFDDQLAKSGFVMESKQGLGSCKQCRYLSLCRGGCRRDRQAKDLHVLGENYFCSAYKQFYKYAVPRLLQLVRQKADA